jgi:hypothetical protein
MRTNWTSPSLAPTASRTRIRTNTARFFSSLTAVGELTAARNARAIFLKTETGAPTGAGATGGDTEIAPS